jgi:hypothetical protein
MLAQIEKEYAHPYPALAIPALAFIDAPYTMPSTRLYQRLQDQLLRANELPNWLEECLDSPDALVKVLYETGIVGVQTSGGRLWFDQDRPFTEIAPALDQEYPVIVHPAFHRYFHCLGI